MNIKALLTPHSQASLCVMIMMLISALALQSAIAQPPADAAPQSETQSVVDVSFDRDAAISGINDYINSISTVRARFEQTAPDGSSAQGLLSMSRPGRLRFEYDDPTPIVIISDGTTIAIEDRELETVDRAPLRSTPLWWLLKSDVDLASDSDIVDIQNEFGRIYLTLEDSDGEMEGQIIFVFSETDFALIEWYVTDALGQNTHIILLDSEENVRLNPRLFVIRDPEEDRSSRRGRR